ncbi:MAG TPA: antibiotic biosynthesis monooxygenase [Thermoanaerobaculia bacterium]|nr:antibiotic biosynthesis monooxygenase [Thermoanaerobaculia bacterium]
MRCKSLVSTVVLCLCLGAGNAAAFQAAPYSDTLMFVDWWVQDKPDYRKTVLDALKTFTSSVKTGEPGTRIYLLYTPKVPSQPPAGTGQIIFVENYQDEQAFNTHLNNFNAAIRNRFGGLFVPVPNSALDPFIQVTNADRYRSSPTAPPAGYIRPGAPHRAAITQNVRWWLKPTANRQKVLQDLAKFAAFCEREEPGTLIYLFSLPEEGQVWPPANDGEIVFMAAYESQAAFDHHVDNWNKLFLDPNKDAFVTSPDGDYPFIQVLDLEFFDGFVRPEVTTGGGSEEKP